MKRLFDLIMVAILMFSGSSCLKDMPETFPERVDWDPELAVPLLEKRFGMNAESGFDTSLFYLDTIREVPEWVNEEELVFDGTVDFDISLITDNLDHLRTLLLRTNIYNGFPHQMRTQGYFVDPGMNYLDSIFDSGPVMVQAAEVVGTGETTRPAHLRQDVTFDRERILKVQDAYQILLRVRLTDLEIDTLLIPYYLNYHFDVKIGAMAGLDMEF